MANARKLSANRLLVQMIENGLEAEARKQQEFFALAERFRNATDPEEVKRLGDQMGQLVFRLRPKIRLVSDPRKRRPSGDISPSLHFSSRMPKGGFASGK